MTQTPADHKGLIASLPVARRSFLTEKSDRAGLKHLAAHLGWCLLFGCYVAAGAPLWGLALVPLGVCLAFLFTLLHETVHFTPFKTPWLNRIVGHFCSLVLVVPNQWFRYFHLAHHKHTNDPAHDPELESPRPQTLREYFWHVSAFPYWRATWRLLIRQAQGEVAAPYLPPRAERICIWQARGMLAFYAVVLGLMLSGWYWIFWCWALPLVLGQPFLRLFLLAEHGHCPPVANMFENTRTTFTNRIIRFLAWNMPYHAEHHAYPAIPFYRLPAFHGFTREALKSTARGYGAFHRDYLKDISETQSAAKRAES